MSQGAKRHLINVTRAQFANRRQQKKTANLSVILHSQIACGQLKLIEFENAGAFCEAYELSRIFHFRIPCTPKLDQLTAHNVSWKLLSFVAMGERQPFGAYFIYTSSISHNAIYMHSRRSKGIQFQWERKWNESNETSADAVAVYWICASLNIRSFRSATWKSTHKIEIKIWSHHAAFHPR